MHINVNRKISSKEIDVSSMCLKRITIAVKSTHFLEKFITDMLTHFQLGDYVLNDVIISFTTDGFFFIILINSPARQFKVKYMVLDCYHFWSGLIFSKT